MADRTLLRVLGKAVAEARRERGVSQEELGLSTGVHRNYIGGIERGERNPSVAVVAKLAAALDTELSDLFKRAGR
jgi:transcriptional regulator with XRE-family HTH domain